jgi:drug/metabolite transporter (DMT)-like permease
MTARGRAELILLSTTIIWGGTFVVSKVALDRVAPFLLIAIRFGVAATLLFALARGRVWPGGLRPALRGGFLGLLFFLGFATQMIGLAQTSSSKCAFITNTTVIFVPILQLLIERRAPRAGNVVGIAIVVVGLWLLTRPLRGVEDSGLNAGDLWTLACAVLFGSYTVWLDVVSKEMETIPLTFLQLAVTAVLAVAACGVQGVGAPRFTPGLVVALLYLTLPATLLTCYLQTRVQKHSTPTRAAVIFSIEPVLAAALAAAFLGERIGGAGVVGGALIIVGVLVSELSDGIPWRRRRG